MVDKGESVGTAKTSSLEEQLQKELGFSRGWAVSYVRARGRCEYCGNDLLMSRQGYASAQLDHLLPQSKYPKFNDDVRNLVLACSTCNGIKSNFDPLDSGDDPSDALDKSHDKLVWRSRAKIRNQMEQKHDDLWRKATKILFSVWWLGE